MLLQEAQWLLRPRRNALSLLQSMHGWLPPSCSIHEWVTLPAAVTTQGVIYTVDEIASLCDTLKGVIYDRHY